MSIPFSTTQLAKIAAFGGVFVIGNGLLMKWLMQKRLRQSPYLEHAKDVLMKNRALVDMIGEPVGFGSVNLDDPRNYSTPDKAKFDVPLKGSKSEGMLFVEAVRNVNDDESNSKSYHGWELQRLEVTLKDRPNQKLSLVKQSKE